jgi:geranylgeranyl diphosphate synthase, type I
MCSQKAWVFSIAVGKRLGAVFTKAQVCEKYRKRSGVVQVATEGDFWYNKKMKFRDFREDFDQDVRPKLAALISRTSSLTSSELVHQCLRHTDQLFFGGGKRIRPYLVELSYQSAGGSPGPELRDLSFGIELFHFFALLHDDVMDRADLRHGVPTLQALVRSEVGSHVADANAVLVGDLVHGWVTSSIARASQVFSPVIAEHFQCMLEEVVVGQMLDIEATIVEHLSEERFMEKTRLKTSRYTFVGPIRIGAAAAGHDFNSFAEEFGTAMGMAFQFQDDLFDIVSTSESLAKSAQNDIKQRQHSFFSLYVQEKAPELYRNEWQRIWAGGNASVEDLRVLFEESGAINAGRQAIDAYLYQAEHALQHAPFSTDQSAPWSELIASIRNRLA